MFFPHLKIHLVFIAQRYQLHLLHAMVFNLQRLEHIVAYLNFFTRLRNALQILHQQTCNGVILALFIQRQGNILDQVFKRHMAVGRP